MKMVMLLFLLLSNLFPMNALANEDQVIILIDKSDNKLFIIMNETIVFNFLVSTGQNTQLTPEGTFSIIRKVKNPWYIPKNIPGGDPLNPVGTRWLGLDVPHTNGYKFGIHGTNDPKSIGKHVSQGCIRMNNTDVEWLYRHIPLGTKVIIQP